ncbi:hypothetical protein [Kordia sp.]|uniref:hypothetical protein n=1 Tax=Kordia sp. TaxID=1965332 RepID=UPI003D29825D
MKNFIKLFIACAFLVSCGDFEEVIYDGVNGQPIAFFDETSSTIEVEINQTNSGEVKIGVSTLSSSDRTITVSADAASTADPAMYSFNSTVTIPANEYFGTLTVTGIDEGLTTAGRTVLLNVEDSSGIVGSTASHTLTLVEVCPTPDTYMLGQYMLQDTSGLNFTDETVTIVSTGPNSRRFQATWYPGFAFATVVDIDVNLICNQFSIQDVDDVNVSCTQGNPPFIILTAPAPADRSNYDLSSDTVLTVNYLFDPENSCGTAIETLTLTKI